MGFMRATYLMFIWHVGRTFRSKRALMCWGLAAMPILASLLIAQVARVEGPPPALEIGWVLGVQLIVPLVALVAGAGVVAEEVDDRTITYLLTRPIARASVLLGRWLAAAFFVSVVLWLSSEAFLSILARLGGGAATEGLPSDMRRRLVSTIVLGGIVYTAVFATLGARWRRAMIVGLGYAFAVEGFLANIPGSNQKLTLQFYLKSFMVEGNPEIAGRLLGAREAADLIPADEALRALLAVLVVALLWGSYVMSRREFLLPS